MINYDHEISSHWDRSTFEWVQVAISNLRLETSTTLTCRFHVINTSREPAACLLIINVGVPSAHGFIEGVTKMDAHL